MFENFSTALIQLIGFFGVFGFFVYQLLSDKKDLSPENSSKKPKDNKVKNKLNRGLFGRKEKIVLEEQSKSKKKRWFQK
tara:strand:+ start:51 stop:287 length:237 start_codon:yes stop_codon:yes gene_type:complete